MDRPPGAKPTVQRLFISTVAQLAVVLAMALVAADLDLRLTGLDAAVRTGI
jgi:hypothetical protein